MRQLEIWYKKKEQHVSAYHIEIKKKYIYKQKNTWFKHNFEWSKHISLLNSSARESWAFCIKPVITSRRLILKPFTCGSKLLIEHYISPKLLRGRQFDSWRTCSIIAPLVAPSKSSNYYSFQFQSLNLHDTYFLNIS